MRHTPSVFTRLRSAWSVVLTLSFCLVDTWFCLIDSKEVTVHWAHGNAVINHTFCVFWWLIFQFPRSPVSCPSLGRYWCLAPYINRASNVSSATDFLGVSVSVWQIVLYNDISEINCCILTDFEENEGLWLRILESGHLVMVMFGQNRFRERSVIL